MKKIIEKSLILIAIASIALSSALLIYKINIHSDILFLEYFMQDIFNHNGLWSYWKFSPAPSYFPDMLLYALGYYFIDTAPLRIFFVTIAQIFLITYLADWLTKKIRPKASVSARSLVLFFLFVAVIAANHTGMVMGIGIFFDANNIQVPTLISSILLLGLYISFLNHAKWIIGLWIIILGGIAQASSAVFLLSFVIPYFLVLIFLLLYFKRKKESKLYKNICISLAILIISQVFGYFLSSILTYHSPLEGRILINREGVNRSLSNFVNGTINILDPHNPWSLFAFIVFSMVFLYAFNKSFRLVLRAIRSMYTSQVTINPSPISQNIWTELMVSLFLIFSAATSVVGSIVSGGFADIYGYRYFMTFIAVSCILASIFIEKKSTLGNEMRLQILIAVTFLTVATASALAVIFSENKRDISEISSLGAVYRDEEEIARCLDDIAKSGVKLYSGIGDFWNSRGVRFYLNNRIFIQPTLNNLNPFFWISSAESIVDPAKYNIEKYNFVILKNENNPGGFSYDIKSMKNYLPDGFDVYMCKHTNAMILVYKNNTLDEKLKIIFGNFSFEQFNSGSRLIFPAAQLPGITGSVVGSVRIASQFDSPGIMVFGPYVKLSAGNYLFESNLKSSGGLRDIPIGHLEIGRFDVPEKEIILKKADIAIATDNLTLKFTVPDGGIENLETRIYFHGSGSLQIKDLIIQRLN